MSIKELVMKKTGETAKAEGWSEDRLIRYVNKRGASAAETEIAVKAYREVTQ